MNVAAVIFVLGIAGCAVVKVEGECTMVREIKSTYHCDADGKLHHFRVEPTQQ